MAAVCAICTISGGPVLHREWWSVNCNDGELALSGFQSSVSYILNAIGENRRVCALLLYSNNMGIFKTIDSAAFPLNC
jgi:hypothetical protein